MTIEKIYPIRMCANCSHFTPCVEITYSDRTGSMYHTDGECSADHNDVEKTLLTAKCEFWEGVSEKYLVVENINAVAGSLAKMLSHRKVQVDEDEFDSYFAGGK